MSSAASPQGHTVAVAAGEQTTALLYPAAGEGPLLVLGHGAGAGQHHPFLVTVATSLAALGVSVVTFDFLYIARGRRLPDKTPVLEACFSAVVEQARVWLAGRPLFIGGKSLGARMATHLAASGAVPGLCGVVALGYPLHPPGRPAQRRVAHLPRIRVPLLVLQGTRDAFGTPDDVRGALTPLGRHATVVAVEGGDHSFGVTKRGKQSQADVYTSLAATVATWMETQISGS